VTKDQLPELSTFEWFGSGGPAEEQQKKQLRVQSLALALQLDQAGAQMGIAPKIDKDKAVEQVLREGGWTDIDAITATTGPAGTAPPLPIAAVRELPSEVAA
jgi:hypothetical protein